MITPILGERLLPNLGDSKSKKHRNSLGSDSATMSEGDDEIDARLQAAKEERAAAFRAACQRGLVNLTDFWVRATTQAERLSATTPLTATFVTLGIGFDPHAKHDGARLDSLCHLLRGVAQPEGGWPTADKFPTSDTEGSRLLARAFIGILREMKPLDEKSLAEATQPPSETTTPRPKARPGAPDGVVATVLSQRDRNEARVSSAKAWQKKHTPPPTPWHASVSPSMDMLVKFDVYRTAATAPNILQLDDYIACGRAQSVPSGRTCYLLDVLAVLDAAETMYAGPMPEGCKVDSSVDTTMLAWEEEVVDKHGKKKTVTVERPAQLSGRVVREAKEAIIAALSPLEEAQQKRHANNIWNKFMAEATALDGYGLSRALHRAINSDKFEAAVTAERSRRADDERRDRPPKRDRDERGLDDARLLGSPRLGRSREDKEKHREEQSKRPFCRAWERDGSCRDHAAGECKTARHPDGWRNIGRAAWEKKRKSA